MNDRYKIGISGSYGGLNLGDEAILQSMIAQLRAAVPVEITVFTRDAEDTQRRHQVERAIPVRTFSRAEIGCEALACAERKHGLFAVRSCGYPMRYP